MRPGLWETPEKSRIAEEELSEASMTTAPLQLLELSYGAKNHSATGEALLLVARLVATVTAG